MSRRIEIQPASKETARVETWVNDRCTGVTEPLPREIARQKVAEMAKPGDEVVDHTERGFGKFGRRKVGVW